MVYPGGTPTLLKLFFYRRVISLPSCVIYPTPLLKGTLTPHVGPGRHPMYADNLEQKILRTPFRGQGANKMECE